MKESKKKRISIDNNRQQKLLGPVFHYILYTVHYIINNNFCFFRISITTIFRSDLLLRNFHVNDQHIQIFDGSMDADSDSCVLNNFFDVRKE